jgi:tetratricopeptide (TPR) repeat protein
MRPARTATVWFAIILLGAGAARALAGMGMGMGMAPAPQQLPLPVPMTMRGPDGATALGSVSFKTSCRARVTADFNLAVALLHSFWLDAAESLFRRVSVNDPGCAMAYWGIAMAEFTQLNGVPTDSGGAAIRQILAQADQAPEKTAREAAYIAALHRAFDDYRENDFLADSARYTQAMAQLAANYPDDLEAKVFFALALLNSDPPEDVDLVNRKEAVAVLGPLLRAHPEHPGIAHYIIHACDNPEMAQLGLEAARRYAAIAPAAPHALHMPSHIFARMGLWQDDIRSNLKSKAAAENPRMPVGAESRLHAMQFLEYAYLQTGQFKQARAMLVEAATVRASDVDPRYPTFYPILQMRNPALFALETHDWSMALRLEAISGADWSAQAQTLLAHTIAAAHLNDAQAAELAAQTLESLIHDKPELQPGSARATLADEIRAWARYAQGDTSSAFALVRVVADRQEKVGKNEVELPAREMLADMLFLSEQYAAALDEYQRSLKSDPNRFNGLLGAAQSAARLGQSRLAADFYRALLANCAHANDEAVVLLAPARSFLKSHS